MHTLDPESLAHRLIELKSEHRDLDAAIAALAAKLECDELQLRRLKKRKLAVKDQIAWVENQLIPDLDA